MIPCRSPRLVVLLPKAGGPMPDYPKTEVPQGQQRKRQNKHLRGDAEPGAQARALEKGRPAAVFKSQKYIPIQGSLNILSNTCVRQSWERSF